MMLARVENCVIRTQVAACTDYGGPLNNFKACAKDNGEYI
jgi:hypothetical protein